MANIVVLDGSGDPVFIKSTGAGTDIDPYILIRAGNVTVIGALPAGTNNIGHVDVDSLPTLASVTTIDALTAIINALPTGGNKIGKVEISDPIPIGTNKIGDVGVDAIAGALPAGSNNIGDVDIASALPAGDNNIGNVDLASPLPAGTNNIGDVDVATLPSLPAGTNNIGDVDLASSIPAGTNNIGDVDLASAIPAGTNNIGLVEVNSLRFTPASSTHGSNACATVQTISPPDSETKVLLQAQGGDLRVTFEGTAPVADTTGFLITPDQPMLVHYLSGMTIKCLTDTGDGSLQYEWGN